MQSIDYRLGFVAALGLIAGIFLMICDLGDTPWIFENGKMELACFAPMIVWLAGRRLRLWPSGRF